MNTKNVLNEKDLKNSYSQIEMVLYHCWDVFRVVEFCKEHGYKMGLMMHDADDEENKKHYHVFIRSDSKHRFNVKTLVSDTLRPYNMAKCKDNTMLKFANYCMHNDFDMKKKYRFEDMVFVNLSESAYKELERALTHRLIGTIEDRDIYTPEEFERLLWKGMFNSWADVIGYLTHTEQTRRYLTFHLRQIKDAFYETEALRDAYNKVHSQA